MNLDDAKQIYWKNGCSAFFIARDEERCEEFRNLHISKEELEEWATEYLNICVSKIKEKESSKNFASALLVAGEHRSVDNLRIFTNMLLNLRYDDELTQYSVCYSILGMRNLRIRCGILDYTKDSRDEELYRSLLDYTKSLLSNMIVDDDNKHTVDLMREQIKFYA